MSSQKQKFYLCEKCGNMIGIIKSEGAPLLCCDERMQELIPNTVEASVEKHLPVIEPCPDSLCVKIGSLSHPMEEDHHISFVYVETKYGGQRKALKIGGEAQANFTFKDDEPKAVYAYCNLHGLWKTDIK